VKRFFPNTNPIAKRFCIDPTNKTYWFTIVGVVADMHRSGLLERPAIPEYSGPYLASPIGRADLPVRAKGDPLRLAAAVRREISAVIPSAMIAGVSTADGQLGGFTAQHRLQAWLLIAFAMLGLALAGRDLRTGALHRGRAHTRDWGAGGTRRDAGGCRRAGYQSGDALTPRRNRAWSWPRGIAHASHLASAVQRRGDGSDDVQCRGNHAGASCRRRVLPPCTASSRHRPRSRAQRGLSRR